VYIFGHQCRGWRIACGITTTLALHRCQQVPVASTSTPSLLERFFLSMLRRNFASWSGALATAAFLCVAVFSAPVAGLNNNPCTTTWAPNQVATDFECNDAEVKDWLIVNLPACVVPAVLGIIVFFMCPFFFCGRYVCGCCGGSTQRPGHCCCGGEQWDGKPEEELLEAYSLREVCLTRWIAVAVVAFPVTYIALCFAGAGSIIAGVDDIRDGSKSLVKWVMDDVTRVANALQNDDGSYPSQFSSFESEYNDINTRSAEVIDNWFESSYVGDFKFYTGLLGFPTIIPAIFMVLGVAMALCRIRQCVPMMSTFFLFLFSLPFGMCATVFFLVNLPYTVFCNEIDAQLTKQPGVFQNYVIPQCNDFNPARLVDDSLDNVEKTASKEACNQMRTVCDSSSTYSGFGDIIWQCDSRVCNTVEDVNEVLGNMTLKIGAPNPCNNNIIAQPGDNCTMSLCKTQCTGQLQEFAENAVTAINIARRVLHAWSASLVLQEWKNCNTFIDHILSSLKLCGGIPTGIRMLAAGFLLVVIGNIAGIIMFTLGSKRFFDRDRFERGNAAFGGKAPPMLNTCTVITQATYAGGTGGRTRPTKYVDDEVPASPLREGYHETSPQNLEMSLL
jgi:hypothetical protein